ncbi:MAG: carboxy terminal-processing peptidase [Pseudomonadales bacterium]|nr:carboxy terminal-processing peptidase [Pseudomonadales bacterium]
MKKFVSRFFSTIFYACLLISASANAVVEERTQLPLHPMPVHTTTTQNIVDALASRHYVPSRLDDNLSSRILDTYINDLDPSKSYFLKSDIDEFEKYRYELDEALKRGNLNPAFDIFNRYHVRVISRFEKVLAMLDEGIELFDFTKQEELLVNREEAPWATTEAELDELWRKRVKDAVLNLKLTDKEPEKIKELLVKRFTNRLSRSRQTNSEDVYQLYMNSFTKTYDPHTQYFSPRTSENFNINMSLSLEGIGAVLQLEDEYTKVVSLVPAGPADKAGVLKPNDKIIAVGQGEDGDMVDVIGWRLDEVVQLIRGRKDTVVKLDIIPAADDDGIHRTISIVRNKVELEEQSAKSEVIEIEQFGSVHKIGVIDIPTFYVDFKALQKGDRNFKSTTRDVKRLIQELQEEDIDGIVIDLRDNGGGSLQEAKMLTGLFIDRGPTVQIRSKSNRVDILNDRDLSVVYDGPLAVLVNRLSASASEIFAGAIQDYERGIIIGSQTFGKGTVQSLLPLNRGQLKLTQAKFYRISGESTQEKGIIPDILYPSSYDPESIGESTLEEPLPWDKITATNYRRKHLINHLVPELRSLHEERIADNPEFNYLKEAFAYRKARSEDDYVSLNKDERLQEKEEREAFWLALENKKREALGQDVLASLDDLDKEEEPTVASTEPAQVEGSTGGAIVPDSKEGEEPVPGSEMAGSGTLVPAVGEAEAEEENEETPDPYLVESGHILLDLISLEERTAAELKQSHGS